MSEVSIAFLGSHPLGERCLTMLADHPDISIDIVVTYPPNEKNWWDGCLYDVAKNLDLKVVPMDEEETILEHDIDYLFSVYYPNILGEGLLNSPRKMALNLHQAELPRYRGSNVFSHSIMNARDDDHWLHGTTLHVMAEEVDAGDIIDRRFAVIEEHDTALTLYEKVVEESVVLFEENLEHVINDEILDMRKPQSTFEGPRYYYAKSSLVGLKEIPMDQLYEEDVAVYDRIRALDFPPHEPAYTWLEGEKVYLTLNGYECS